MARCVRLEIHIFASVAISLPSDSHFLAVCSHVSSFHWSSWKTILKRGPADRKGETDIETKAVGMDSVRSL